MSFVKTLSLVSALTLLGALSPILPNATAQVVATGGDQVFDILVGDTPYRVHVYTNVGSAVFDVQTDLQAEYLIVGGGGGGGSRSQAGGGGGAGGLFQGSTNLTANTYTIVVGKGGAGAKAANVGRGESGDPSSAFGITATGGGGGGASTNDEENSKGLPGGSGGGGGQGSGSTGGALGGAAVADPEQGHDGGNAYPVPPVDDGNNRAGGGGGGAGGPGGNASANTGGAAGPGLGIAIDDDPKTYAVGGRGGQPSGTAQDGDDNTGNGGDGSFVSTNSDGGDGGSGIVVIRYPLDDVDYLVFEEFTLANIETGSTRFTNSNEVDIVSFPIPDDYDRYQITTEGELSAIDPNAWIATNLPPASKSFDPPASDAAVTLYAWFTNNTESVTLLRSEGGITYTTVTPEPEILDALTFETAGFSVRIAVDDLDTGSTGGLYGETPLEIFQIEARWDDGPYPDATPDDSYVTLTNAGTYAVKLRVVNEAGNVAESAASCTVTLNAMADPPTADRYVAAHNFLAEAPYTNWTTAAGSIQEAVNESATSANELILVAPGIYTLPPAPQTYDSVANVAHVTKAVTLRSASGKPEDTIIDGEDQYRGIYISPPEHTQAVIDGFTIRHGRAVLGNGRGGGVVMRNLNNRTIVLQNSIVESNTAGDSGGGVYIGNSTSGNFTAMLSNTVVRLNQAPSGRRGGGIGTEMQNSNLVIVDCTITHNTSIPGDTWEAAGGISIRSRDTKVLIDRSVLAFNDAHRQGAIYITTSSLTLRNSLLIGNSGLFGAITLRGSSELILENSTFADNSHAAIYYYREGTANLQGYNAILYNDSIAYGNDVTIEYLHFEHSCRYPTAALLPGANNINLDPKLVDPENQNYRLSRESPCINTGTNMTWMTGATDLDGKRRVDGVYNQVDMGAYEFQYAGTILLIR